MAKLTKDEFNSKYAEKITDDDLLIELMEDVTDSISSEENEELVSLQEEIKTTKQELADLKEKYKQRFLHAVEDDEIDDSKIEELHEEEKIDIKEI